MQHFIITTLALNLNPTPHSNYHQWELGIYKSTPVKKENWLCKIKIVFCRRTSSMFSCVQKSTSTGISVSNQSLQCGSSAITLYDGRCCVSSRSSPVPLPHSSSTWMCPVRHLKAQWNGTFIIAVSEFHVIFLKYITHFTTVSHYIPAINQTVRLH